MNGDRDKGWMKDGIDGKHTYRPAQTLGLYIILVSYTTCITPFLLSLGTYLTVYSTPSHCLTLLSTLPSSSSINWKRRNISTLSPNSFSRIRLELHICFSLTLSFSLRVKQVLICLRV